LSILLLCPSPEDVDEDVVLGRRCGGAQPVPLVCALPCLASQLSIIISDARAFSFVMLRWLQIPLSSKVSNYVIATSLQLLLKFFVFW